MIDDWFSTNSTAPVDNFVEKSLDAARKARETRDPLVSTPSLQIFQSLKNQGLANIPQIG
ncbi:conserved protein of unknown function [Cupriavidus neocaledonicus]|uniref:Uncharacterized protein n=1 Tax=Cupriavidus neocaledonicus TaxID=1040979 RepID=A0A375HDY2_9BURK|nr:conserved protein of unknown function [Cupriavidus neocaledonicus]